MFSYLYVFSVVLCRALLLLFVGCAAAVGCCKEEIEESAKEDTFLWFVAKGTNHLS